jgi:hypothetical protein
MWRMRLRGAFGGDGRRDRRRRRSSRVSWIESPDVEDDDDDVGGSDGLMRVGGVRWMG